MNILRISAFSIGFCCTVAQADEAAIARYKDYYPEQIMQLSEKERQSSVPMMFTGVANQAMSEAGELLVQSALNSLMYNGLSDIEAAKRAFQKDLGESPTGRLTVWQLHQLGYRSSRLNLTYVNFFSLDYGGTMNADVASVKGTVKIIDERIAYPINHVDVECFRTNGYCKYRQVALTLPDENSFSQSYVVSEIIDEYYKITRWDGQQIDATPYNSAACRINQLIFNFETKEYFEIARNNTSADCELALGVTLPRLEKPRVSQIVDGQDIINAEFKRLNDEAFGYYSSDFRARVGRLQKGGRVAADAK